MKKAICFILLWMPLVCMAQTYRYISAADGLSNQKIYRIQKDYQGYMWFLTHLGIDRYNGKEIKHYQLTDRTTGSNPQAHLDWTYVDSNGLLWAIGRTGRVFQYDPRHDRFNMVYKLGEQQSKSSPHNISYGFLDYQDRIWLCLKDSVILYDTQAKEMRRFPSLSSDEVTAIEQIAPDRFFVGTSGGVFSIQLEQNVPQRIPCAPLDSIHPPVSELYFHPATKKLFIGTLREGVWVYDLSQPDHIVADKSLSDVNITRIAALDKEQILVATDGRGVFRMHADSCQASQYIAANYNSYNEMNGNNINDIYIDEDERIWLANYPNGITVRDNRYTHHNWIKHSIGNSQSLINDQVYCVMEDSEGDLWFGTSNGISLYQPHTGKWSSFVSSFEQEMEDKNHIILTLCEVSPGVIWAGGYTSGIYQIYKKSLSVDYFSPSAFSGQQIRPDQYIRAIRKDSQGLIWSGGYYNLKSFDLPNKQLRSYPGLTSITSILEKDKENMWIGTMSGLFLLEKKSGNHHYIDLPVESAPICALYQKGENLYIGTGGSGLLVYHIPDGIISHYHTDNCALISDNIYTIIPKPDGSFILGTENGIVNFFLEEGQFHNWTKEQGLMSVVFNAGAGILYQNSRFIMGSNDGVIEFPADMQIPTPRLSPIVLSDFRISYQTVYAGDEGSPLTIGINQTEKLKLKYSQNTFSLKVSSINYDYPSNMLYSWKMEGFYNEWSRPSSEGTIRFTNLAPGKYTLRIRSISNEEKYKVGEERSLRIIIAPPAWASTWAILIYLVIVALICANIYRIARLRRRQQSSEEKTRFFIQTAHDIRTPLSMIKAPLEEMKEKQQVGKEGLQNMDMALRNVEILTRLTENLVNFEKAGSQQSGLHIAEYELNSYLTELRDTFKEYADKQGIALTYEADFPYTDVWFDREKMDSILKNLLTNALKYTPEGGDVHIIATENKETWSVEVKDTGIGIPAHDQKKLFKTYFRASNVVNLKVSGSGIGLMLVYKLVRLHHGKIVMNSAEQQGTSVKVTFPKGKESFRNAQIIAPVEGKDTGIYPLLTATDNNGQPTEERNHLPHLLIVEDNDDLRNYLSSTFSESYQVLSCNNGKEALPLVKEFNPALVISDIMMPEMRGDELCTRIKGDIETSHIPVILLTALGDEKSVIEGLETGADDYIAKPFSVGILKASVSSILANRALLRKRYGNLDFDEKEGAPAGNMNKQEWEFIAAVKRNIESNIANADFNVDMLCAMHHMSRTSFFKKLKALTGKSPSDHIHDIRMRQASKLLHEGYNVTEVADMCGFCDAKYFREVFKKHFNENPSQHVKGDREKRKGDE